MLGCSKSPNVIIDKSTVKKLLEIAQSDHERQCIRYAVFKASGVTLTQARKKFGFENMGKKAQHVKVCINSNRAIREAIDDLATTEDEALLASFGIFPDNNIMTSDSEDSDSLSLSALSETEEGFEAVAAAAEDALSLENFKQIVCGCQYNWFDIVESCPKISEASLAAKLETVVHENSLGLEDSKIQLLLQSKEAFHKAVVDAYENERIARAVNGEIVTDSESDINAEDLVGLHDIVNNKGKSIIQRLRTAIKLRAKRMKARVIAEERFLSRKVSKRISKVKKECPDIGKTIEDFVSAGSVGAELEF